MNYAKTLLLLTGLTLLFVWVGRMLGGMSGMLLGFGLALVLNIGSYWFSDKIVLRMSRARPIGPAEAPELYQTVIRLSERAGIPAPKLYVIDDPSPNAFATGRDPAHAAVAVNTGLIQLLDRPEVAGVIAHELAHVKHRDTLIGAIAATLAGAIMMIAEFARFALYFGGMNNDDGEGQNPLVLLPLLILAPLAATLIRLAISRSREYEADRVGGELCGQPLALAGALRKLEQGNQLLPSHAAAANASLYIVNPFSGRALLSLLSTHPPTEERIARLEAQAQGRTR